MNDMSVEEWYSRQCNGEWEHGFGVEIATIDNPMVSQYLHDTSKRYAVFARVKIDRGQDDWISLPG